MPDWIGVGNCKWCAGEIRHPEGHKRAGEINTRSSWHPACVEIYKTCAWPNVQRKTIKKRDKGRCAGCQMDVVKDRYYWEADHRIPLWSLPEEILMEDRTKYFGLENLQILCDKCHKEKCAKEAEERAQIRAEKKAKGKR